MPIPPFRDHVLPPFVGSSPAEPDGRSPYVATLEEFVDRFATSAPRAVIIRGYLDYRAGLRAEGLTDGYQWLDGSFVEDVETARGQPPNDLDIVTFFRTPTGTRDSATWQRDLFARRPELVCPPKAKARFHCDVYFVGLSPADEVLARVSTYWYGLFSHRRGDALWKGMVQVRIEAFDDPPAARTMIDGRFPP